MLTAQIGLINPTDYWSTARSGGQDGLGGPVEIRRLEINENFTIEDVNRQLAYLDKKLPYRGEMRLSKTVEGTVMLEAYPFFERHSTWIALGIGAAGVLAGVLIGRATKR